MELFCFNPNYRSRSAICFPASAMPCSSSASFWACLLNFCGNRSTSSGPLRYWLEPGQMPRSGQKRTREDSADQYSASAIIEIHSSQRS